MLSPWLWVPAAVGGALLLAKKSQPPAPYVPDPEMKLVTLSIRPTRAGDEFPGDSGWYIDSNRPGLTWVDSGTVYIDQRKLPFTLTIALSKEFAQSRVTKTVQGVGVVGYERHNDFAFEVFERSREIRDRQWAPSIVLEATFKGLPVRYEIVIT